MSEATTGAVTYIRVSTRKQVEMGEGLAIQAERIHNFCKKNGINVIAEFSDDGISGSLGIDERAGLDKMLRFCAENKNSVDAVIVDKIDRLSRDVMVYFSVEKELKKLGIKLLFACTESLNGDSEETWLQKGMLSMFAQYERKNIVKRITDGLDKKSKLGMKPCGRQPLGYRFARDGKETEVVKPQARIVHKIYEMRADGMTIDEIHETLAADPRVEEVLGKPITRGRIFTVLKNDFYIGIVTYSSHKIQGTHPPIIERSLWLEVNGELPNVDKIDSI